MGWNERAYIPCRGTIVGLRVIMIPIAVSSKEENLVLDVARRFLVQTNNLVVETLPLSQVFGVPVVCFTLVGAVNKAEVLLVLFRSVKAVVRFGLIFYLRKRRWMGLLTPRPA